MSWFSKNFGTVTKTSTTSTSIIPESRGKIGAFGNTLFSVSSEEVLTFRDWNRKISANFKTHDVIGQKSVTEFLSPNLQTVSFKIQLLASLGVDPLIELDRLEKMCESGEAQHLIIGNVVIGENLWIIESISEDETRFLPTGEILYTELTLNLKEYV